MRWAFVVCVWLGLLASPLTAETFPYTAYVAAEGAVVRSGPGPTYYPTSELSAGATVEVYRLDPGGWCAIRPPEDSFSWVPAEAIALSGEEGLGRVAAEHVMTRVGTTLGPEKDVRYIELELGEMVEILGADRVADASGTTTLWFRIAPPAGEFRWVELADLMPRATDEVAAALASAENVALATADGQVLNEWVEAGGTSAVPAQFVEQEPATPLQADPSQGFVPRATAEAQTQSIEQLELELAAMVAQDPSTWQLDVLHQRADAATRATSDTQLYSRGQALLSRIEEYQQISRQYTQLGPVPFSGASVPPRRNFFSALASGLGGARYDGQGYLTRITTDDPNKRLYGLTNADGQILYLVSPSPSLELSLYEGREVGIIGRRGYVPAPYNKPHLTADRIVDLERLR